MGETRPRATQLLRLLVATWDGAGNLPPILALVSALAARGHELRVIGHDVQRPQIEAAGAAFVGFETAPQWDVGVAGAMGEDPISRFLAFQTAAAADVLAAAAKLRPNAVLIDCMLPEALGAAKAEGYRSVALVHALYSFFVEFAGGVFRGPIDAADLALSFSFAAFDRGVTLPPNLRFVGPARPAAQGAPWPRRHPDRPLVVASLSTGLQGQAGVQLGLLQRVCDALAALPVEALVTTGRGIAPESLTAGAGTTLARLVPHELVLGQADLLITHAGHGTVMAGLRFGVPMLCLGPGADQPFNAARVAALGLGEALEPSASPQAISEAILRLLADRTVKERSRAFAAAVAAQPGLEKAIELVEAFAV